ncbi:MAG: hypothetical protein ABFC56_14610 [Clostridiaceae bacterium]|jgi:hypothetical protein
MAFSFTPRLERGKNGSGSINQLLTSLIAAISAYLEDIVDPAHLTDGIITTAKLADEAVETAKLDDGAVTTAKLDGGSVTGAKLDASAYSVWAVTGADASAAAQDLAAVGVVATLRILEVINHTDGTIVDKSTITSDVDKFVLASGNLAEKKLIIRTLPAEG